MKAEIHIPTPNKWHCSLLGSSVFFHTMSWYLEKLRFKMQVAYRDWKYEMLLIVSFAYYQLLHKN